MGTQQQVAGADKSRRQRSGKAPASSPFWPSSAAEAHPVLSAFAGCAAGLVAVLVLHPLDVVKTRLQVQDGSPHAWAAYSGTRNALWRIAQEEGATALYAGLPPALLGAGLSWGLYFMAYNSARARWRRWQRSDTLSVPINLLAAAEAGCLVSLATNPIWVVKTRLQLQRKALLAAPGGVPQGAYRGVAHAARQIAREEGLRGFYRGLGPSLLLVSHGAIQFAVYEELKKLAGAGWGARSPPGGARHPPPRGPQQQQQRPLGSAEISLIGAASKLAAACVTYPTQVIRTRLQQRQARAGALRYTGTLRALRLTLQREGIPGLYKGLVPHVLRVMPQSAITFLVYEKIMGTFGGGV